MSALPVPFPFVCDNCGHKPTPQEVLAHHGACAKSKDSIIAHTVDAAECISRLMELEEQYDPARTGEITGARDDVTGEFIREGDRVVAYPLKYAEKSRDDTQGIPVVELDTSQPPVVQDTPMFAGVVVWDTTQLAWEVDVSWVCALWRDSPQPSRIRLGGMAYAFITVTADQMPEGVKP